MSLFRSRTSVLALAALVAGAAPAAASPASLDPGDGVAPVADGLEFLKRVLRLGQGDDVVSHSIAFSPREASLELELANGTKQTVSLRAGSLLVDGEPVARYEVGGALERAWRRLLQDATSLDSRALAVALRAWSVSGLSGEDDAAKRRIDQALRSIGSRAPAPVAAVPRDQAPASAPLAPTAAVDITIADLAAIDSLQQQLAAMREIGAEVAASVRDSPIRIGDYVVQAGERVEGDVVVFRGDADIFGTVGGNVVALMGDVTYHRGSEIMGSVVSVGGDVLDDGGTVRGDIRTLSSLAVGTPVATDRGDATRAGRGAFGVALDRLFRDVRTVVVVFIALAMIGFGLAFFGRRYLEVVADTASHSFGRSLVVGLLGQLLLLPTFAMLMVGLALTIVGILLVPVAAVGYVLATAAALLGGYLAVAHAIGETFTRRRMANGAFVRSPNAYGYLFTGLLGLLGLWAFAALLGWAGPVVILVRIAAALVTWIALTAGFGAVLLSRGGLRESFAGRYSGEISDEYLWATPPATPTASRSGPRP